MEPLDLVKYSVESLRHRSLRSWLTVLGIVIGIGSIVVLISLAQGLDTSIKAQLNSFGTNYAVVLPGDVLSGGFRFGPPVLKGILTVKDRDAVARIPGVQYVSGSIALTFAPVEFKDQNVTSSVSGVEAEAYSHYITTEYEAGKFFSPGDTTAVIIGNNVAKTLFDKEIKYGDKVAIMGREFRVKGILKKVGQSGGNLDDAMLIDIKAARAILGDTFDKNRVFAILAVTDPNADIKEISDRIKFELRNRHKVAVGKEDFSVLTADSIAEQIGQITGLLAVFLGGVAAISLLVGGIGVANAMFTSVLERTREIGILKALGASQGKILQLFLLESGIIGLFGGILGVLLGIGISKLLGYLGVPSIITWELMAFSLFFSFLIGLVSGAIPARNASRLEPVEALRYE